jgi:hypothetical protein
MEKLALSFSLTSYFDANQNKEFHEKKKKHAPNTLRIELKHGDWGIAEGFGLPQRS